MRVKTFTLLFPALIVLLWLPGAQAQESKLNTNLGMGVTIPVHPTSQFAKANVNVVVGAGYNFDRHQSLVFQFMWAGLPPTNEALRPIRIAAGSTKIGGSSNLYAGTANYRVGVEGRVFGAYVIGGGGFYYRHSSLSQEVVAGEGTVCGPTWDYWGIGCVSGVVTNDETLISSGSMAFGGNVGAGLTIRIHPDGYKLYFESRYHYAPNRTISTQFIPITIGFSW
jgi:hypothetical protein